MAVMQSYTELQKDLRGLLPHRMAVSSDSGCLYTAPRFLQANGSFRRKFAVLRECASVLSKDISESHDSMNRVLHAL